MAKSMPIERFEPPSVATWSGPIPLSWVRSAPEAPFANLGDALSALVVGAIAGGPVEHADFDADIERMAAIGTIIQDQAFGRVHLWGTGIDNAPVAEGEEPRQYRLPPATELIAHAVRGPHTAAILRRAGVPVPPVYGDPAWFITKILPRGLFPRTPTFEIGVICHISELAEQTPSAGTIEEFQRYNLDGVPRGTVRIINTLTPPTLDGLIAKMAEILSCKRILSSSFHGLVLPLAYGVPALTFGFIGDGFTWIDAADHALVDHRIGDFLAGVGMARVPVLAADRFQKVIDWRLFADIIDREHQPLSWTGRDLLEAFPGRRTVRFDDPRWPIPSAFHRDFAF